MGLEEQGAKPTGFIGTLIGQLMNHFHTNFYVKYFTTKLPADNSEILDIGCGGGKFIKFLAKKNKSYRIYGLDHSKKMVELSEKINKEAINNKQVKIIQGSVTSTFPIKKETLHLITAFETVQFWPDLDKAFSNIVNLLKNGGTFIIINRYPTEGSKWWKMATLKSENDYRKRLEEAGFSQINTDLITKKGWIIVQAKIIRFN